MLRCPSAGQRWWAELNPGEVESLCERLRVPSEHRELALLTARLEQDLARRVDPATSEPEPLLSLLEQADAFRRPERFARWLEVLAARRGAAGVPVNETAQVQARLRTIAAAAAAVQLDRRRTAGQSRPAAGRPDARS